MLSKESARVGIGGRGGWLGGLGFFNRVTFTRRQEQILFNPVLLGIELVIASAQIE
jgi:hypothetical protein